MEAGADETVADCDFRERVKCSKLLIGKSTEMAGCHC
jgi:hypothetical protein